MIQYKVITTVIRNNGLQSVVSFTTDNVELVKAQGFKSVHDTATRVTYPNNWDIKIQTVVVLEN